MHTSSDAIAVQKTNNSGIGWVSAVTYSTASDYDSVDFWINAGNAPTTLTSLAVYDGEAIAHFLHLEDASGAPLPANTWVHLQIPFASPFFETAFSTSPTTIQTVCIINHSGGGNTQFLYVDDVVLIGADIFKSGFEN